MSRLGYNHRSEWVLELETDGGVFVRQRGGPLHHFGHPHNFEVPTVSAWRARVPAARYTTLVAGFEEARSMKDYECWFVPDEHGASLTLGEASLLVVSRALETNRAMDRVVAELTGVAAALRTTPPTERLPNPERDEWSTIPAADRRPSPGAPDAQPGAAGRAQAAVDRFYAQELDALLAHVASRPRPRTATSVEAPPPPIEDASHTFTCRVTGIPAGTVSLRLTPLLGGGELELSDFAPTGGVTVRVKDNELRLLHRDLVAGDARALWKHDDELAPFYCPQCDASYAASQWKIYETSPTRVEGMCPSDHRRRVRAG